MALVEVHVVHPEPPQRGVALLGYVLAREAPVVRPVAHGEVDLGGEKKGVALEALEGVADDLLGRAPHVDVGGVEKVDAEVVGPVDAGRRLLFGDAPAVGEPASEGDLADLHPAPAQPPVLHRTPPFLRDKVLWYTEPGPLPAPGGLQPGEGVLEGVGAYLGDAVEGVLQGADGEDDERQDEGVRGDHDHVEPLGPHAEQVSKAHGGYPAEDQHDPEDGMPSRTSSNRSARFWSSSPTSVRACAYRSSSQSVRGSKARTPRRSSTASVPAFALTRPSRIRGQPSSTTVRA